MPDVQDLVDEASAILRAPVTLEDGTVVSTLWGELAWQLGGAESTTATSSSRNGPNAVPRRTIRCTLSRSLNTSTSCSKTVWNASRSLCENATIAITCTRP